MRARITKKKVAAVVATTAVIALGAGTAVAFWTGTGAGSGTASVGTDQRTTVNQTSPTTTPQLFIGGTVDLKGDFNNDNDFPVVLTRVAAVIASIGNATSDPSKPPCTVDDFMIGGTGVASGQIPAGMNQGSWEGLTLTMVDEPYLDDMDVVIAANNQDNCKNATVNIRYRAS